MATTQKERILAKSAPREKVFVAEWGEEVEVRSMTLGVRSALLATTATIEDGDEDGYADLVWTRLRDSIYTTDTGERLLETPEDLEWLKAQPADVVKQLVDATNVASALTDGSKKGSAEASTG